MSTPLETRFILADFDIDYLADGTAEFEDPIATAVEALAAGDLVAIPTETVYGLGADALNPDAVAKIFAAKERPEFDPLICHLANAKQLDIITEIPDELRELVDKLTAEFWPGPLTLVLPKKDCVPDLVTSGLPTVAVRVPDHPIMRDIAKQLGRPIAAPSANRFGRISPTSAQHVFDELDGRIPLIIDAGACNQGIESTIISLAIGEKRPELTLLRPGPITKEQLQPFGKVIRPRKTKAQHLAEKENPERASASTPNSPGQLAAHYAPSTPLFLYDSPADFTPEDGKKYGLLTYCEAPKEGYINLYEWDHIEALSHGKG